MTQVPDSIHAATTSSRKQVFIAYPYLLFPKVDYRRIFRTLEQAYEVTFIFADEKITNMHIMKKIETFIRGSDFSVFDISGWNPNVTLELGFAMAAGDRWYIAIDPSKTEMKEVPSDLRGLDRIQYNSYDELETKLTLVLEDRYPKKVRASIEAMLEERRTEVRELLKATPGLTAKAISQLLRVELSVAQLILRPMVGTVLRTTGATRGTKYFFEVSAGMDLADVARSWQSVGGSGSRGGALAFESSSRNACARPGTHALTSLTAVALGLRLRSEGRPSRKVLASSATEVALHVFRPEAERVRDADLWKLMARRQGVDRRRRDPEQGGDLAHRQEGLRNRSCPHPVHIRARTLQHRRGRKGIRDLGGPPGTPRIQDGRAENGPGGHTLDKD